MNAILQDNQMLLKNNETDTIFESHRSMAPIERWEWNREQYKANNMNEQLYQEWIDALESGDYTFTSNVLRSIRDEFCCLGVLCDIYDPSIWKPNKLWAYEYLHSSSCLPSILVAELNLTSATGMFRTEDLSPELQDIVEPYTLPPMRFYIDYNYKEYDCALSEINDYHPDPFPIIARILRERPRSLFRE